jgi:hypothetical protein
VKVDCAACHHVALLPPQALLRLGLSAEAKVLDLQAAVPMPRLRGAGASGGVDQLGAREDVNWGLLIWNEGCRSTLPLWALRVALDSARFSEAGCVGELPGCVYAQSNVQPPSPGLAGAREVRPPC